MSLENRSSTSEISKSTENSECKVDDGIIKDADEKLDARLNDDQIDKSIDDTQDIKSSIDDNSLKAADSKLDKRLGDDKIKPIGDVNKPNNVDDYQSDQIEKQNNEIDTVNIGEKQLESLKEKGNYGEMRTDQDLRDRGYKRISKEIVTDINDSGHQGIDGVYFNPSGIPQYLIVDSKFGTAQLSDTLDGKQMSANWIDKRLDESVGKEEADKIRFELLTNPENVGSYVAHVDENGNVTYDKLDADANKIERDVKINET